MRCQIPANGRKPLTQFVPIAPIPTIAKRAEPVGAMGLSYDCAGAHALAALAPGVAWSTDLLQSPKGAAPVGRLWYGTSAVRCPPAPRFDDGHGRPARSPSLPVC